jgi:hypothetical protein
MKEAKPDIYMSIINESGTYGKKLGSQKVYGTWLAALSSPSNDVEKPSLDFSANVYPNPPQNQMMSVDFNLPQSQRVQVELFDISGRKIAILYDAEAKAGKNTFSFSTTPLENGLYIIRIMNNDDMLYTQKITVVQ